MENNVLTKSQFEETFNFLKTMGYSEIRFPGGTDKNYDHFSGVIIYQYNSEKKKVFFLVVPYNSDFFKSHEEDRSRKPQKETYKKTAVREVYEETGLIVSQDHLIELPEARFVAKKNVGTGTHTKNWFITNNFSGHPAKFEAGNLIEAETASPMWVEGTILKEFLSRKHKIAFEKGVNYLASKDRELCMAMMDYLD